MKIVGVIPARWQSSRFPGKMLAHILGKSLIRRTFENTLQCRALDDVVIATDDKRIFDHAKEFGAKVFMTPPSCPTGTDRVWEAVKNSCPEAEIIVNIQGDEPCLAPSVVDVLVEKLIQNPEAVISTPVAPIALPQDVLNPHIVKCVFDREGRALYFSRLPIPYARGTPNPSYYRHIGVYCFRRPFLETYTLLEKTPLQESEDLEQLKILESGFPIHVCVVSDQSIGIDTPEDLITLESFLCKKENIYS